MLREHASIIAMAALALWPHTAWSEPESVPDGEGDAQKVATCASAYEQAQVARSDGRLRLAHEHLETCVEPGCPDFVRADCDRWLDEVESALPSVVLGAKRGGVDVSDVRVMLDDELLVEQLVGRALAIDPGRHKLTFVGADDEQVVIEVVVREGEKNRPIVATFELSPEAPPPPLVTPTATPPTQEPKRRGTLPYVVAGVGVLGIGGFAVLGALGNKQKADREHDCAPNCTDSEVASVRTTYVLADVSLGLGVVALGTAGYLFFAGPPSQKTASRSNAIAVDVVVTRHSAVGTMRARF